MTGARDRTALGIGVMVVTAFTMAFGDALVKHVSASFSVWQMYVTRALIAIPLTILLLAATSRPFRLMPRSVGWTALRSFLMVMMWITFYAALPLLSLPVVAVCYYTGPLFITLFSGLLIGEAVGARRWAAILLGFIGVLVILRPGVAAFSWVTLLPVASAIFYALAMIVTRSKCPDEHPFILSLGLGVAFAIVGAAASVVIVLIGPLPEAARAYPFVFGPWTAMGLREWGIIAALAILIVATSSGVAKAYQSGPPAIIATFDYTYLVFASLWSIVFFAEPPDAATIVGMLLIAAAGMLIVLLPASHSFTAPVREET